MQKSIWVSLFFIVLLSPNVQAQQKQSGEIGVGLGGSYYLGDLNKIPFVNTHFAVTGFYRHTFNYRFVVKGIMQYGFLSAEGNDFQGEKPSSTLNDRIFDIAAMGEFNFIRFLPGNKKYVYSPYLTAGVGYLFTLGSAGNYYFNIPFGAGVKYNLNRDIILGAEMLMMDTFNDKLDYLDHTGEGSRQTSYAGNVDWFSVFSISLAYKIKYEEKCPAIH